MGCRLCAVLGWSHGRGPIPCFFCGYDLSGVPVSGNCPECGRRIVDVRDVLDPQAIARRRGRWILMCVIPALPVVLFILLALAAMYLD